jgi:hypothetical protein
VSIKLAASMNHSTNVCSLSWYFRKPGVVTSHM